MQLPPNVILVHSGQETSCKACEHLWIINPAADISFCFVGLCARHSMNTIWDCSRHLNTLGQGKSTTPNQCQAYPGRLWQVEYHAIAPQFLFCCSVSNLPARKALAQISESILIDAGPFHVNVPCTGQWSIITQTKWHDIVSNWVLKGFNLKVRSLCWEWCIIYVYNIYIYV